LGSGGVARKSLNGEVFMWAGARAQLWLPPLPEGTRLRLPIRIRPGPAPLEVRADGERVAEVAGLPDRVEILDLRRRSEDGPWIVDFHRSGGLSARRGDSRPLALAVENPWLRPPHTVFEIDLASAEARARDGLRLEGAYPLEQFGSLGTGHWLSPDAVVVVDVPGPGLIELDLAAPRPTPPETVVSSSFGRTVAPSISRPGRATSASLSPRPVTGHASRSSAHRFPLRQRDCPTTGDPWVW
jgi:hypothetical protein